MTQLPPKYQPKYHESRPRKEAKEGRGGQGGRRCVFGWAVCATKNHENRPRKPVHSCSENPSEVSEAENRAGDTASERRPPQGSVAGFLLLLS